MKYIINEDNEIKIFSDTITHKTMAISGKKIVGAGFIMVVGNRVSCFGESISLGVASRPEKDGKIINSQLNLGQDENYQD